MKGYESILCERHDQLGSETTSRNSEVIHAGMYYPFNSLKANLCVSGKELLMDYLKERHIDYELCGKIIVSQNDLGTHIMNAMMTKSKSHYNDRVICRGTTEFGGDLDTSLLLS